MTWTVYLAGEVHSNWRGDLEAAATDSGLPVAFVSPVTDHSASDDCGAEILGSEPNAFWHDHKGAGINSIRTQVLLDRCDVVIVKFGEKYRQWNAAFDAGYAIAKQKPLIVIHPPEIQHALKEIDAAASAVCERTEQAVAILRYVLQQK